MTDALMPQMSWSDCLQALKRVAADEENLAVTPDFVSSIRKQAPFLPPSTILLWIVTSGVLLAHPNERDGSPPTGVSAPSAGRWRSSSPRLWPPPP